jgi:hypothetical protein
MLDAQYSTFKLLSNLLSYLWILSGYLILSKDFISYRTSYLIKAHGRSHALHMVNTCCCATQGYCTLAVHCCALLCIAVHCCVFAVHCCAFAVHCCALLCIAVHCCALLCIAMYCCAWLCLHIYSQ